MLKATLFTALLAQVFAVPNPQAGGTLDPITIRAFPGRSCVGAPTQITLSDTTCANAGTFESFYFTGTSDTSILKVFSGTDCTGEQTGASTDCESDPWQLLNSSNENKCWAAGDWWHTPGFGPKASAAAAFSLSSVATATKKPDTCPPPTVVPTTRSGVTTVTVAAATVTVAATTVTAPCVGAGSTVTETVTVTGA